jgi:hypothetical protein
VKTSLDDLLWIFLLEVINTSLVHRGVIYARSWRGWVFPIRSFFFRRISRYLIRNIRNLHVTGRQR